MSKELILIVKKKDAITKISRQIKEMKKVAATAMFGATFLKWRRDTRVAVSYVYKNDPKTVNEFNSSISNIYHRVHAIIPEKQELEYIKGLEETEAFLESCIGEIEEFWPEDDVVGIKEGSAQPTDIKNNMVDEMPDTRKVFVVHGRDSLLRDNFFVRVHRVATS